MWAAWFDLNKKQVKSQGRLKLQVDDSYDVGWCFFHRMPNDDLVESKVEVAYEPMRHGPVGKKSQFFEKKRNKQQIGTSIHFRIFQICLNARKLPH